MSLRDVRTLFFDMGNTLLDFHCGPSDEAKDALGLERMARWIRQRGGRIDAEELYERFFVSWSEVFELRKRTLEEYPVERYLDPCLGAAGIRLDRAERIELMGEFHSGYGGELVIEDGLAATLGELRRRGYAIGVISNCYLYDEVMLGHFRRVGLDGFIDAYTFSYSLGLRKPRPEIFECALERLGARAETSLMIGDSLAADVAGAQSVGMRAVWLNRNGSSNDSAVEPEMVVTRIVELLDRL